MEDVDDMRLQNMKTLEDTVVSQSLAPSGNDVDISQESQLRSTCKSIPSCRFEIEGETFMIASRDEVEPKSVKEALACPGRE